MVDELTDKGHQVAAFRADVSDPAQTHDLVEQVVEAMGGIDIMASNAGVEHFGALESITCLTSTGSFTSMSPGSCSPPRPPPRR